MKRVSTLILCLTAVLSLAAQPVSLLPLPKQYRETKGSLTWKTNTPVQVTMVGEIPAAGTHQEEAYTLTVGKKGVQITAVTETGAYRARQTLEQLKMLKKVPCCEITDWPAFSIRGFMQDVGRTYISMEELKREIDLLARFKVNVFHWHLTENQAWRLESKLYPQLNAPENMTRFPGQFYTQDEARELVRFCKERQVMLIPELDMPGHSEAFVRTFGCDMQSEMGTVILKELIREACEVFKDCPYMHLGTDEVHFSNADFVPEMVDYTRSLGKKVISWNPGWSYKPGEIDMTQLWSYAGKAQEGIPAIDCRLHYLNHYNLFSDIIALYTSRIGNETEEKGVVGTITAIWNDRRLPDEKSIVLQNGLYPHALAAAERAWKGGGSQYFDVNGTMLPEEGTPERDEFVDFERRLLWHKDRTFADVPFAYVKQTHEKWAITDAFPNGGDLKKVFPPEREIATSYTYEGKEYGTKAVTGGGIYLRHAWGKLVQGFYPDPQPNHTAYAYTWVNSPVEQEVGLLVEFQNYFRSEKDLPPAAGTWDYKGSRIWLNGEEVLPPEWTTDASQGVTFETTMYNENAVARDPLRVHLHKGWNRVLLKLPVGQFTTKEVRLEKWMFVCAFVTLDGRHAVENLTYSAEKP